MRVVRTIVDIRSLTAAARAAGRAVGFVPTMGYLHPGHRTLIRAAVDDGCFTAVSIFVNPTQFGPHEDFARYPRDEPRDLALCRDAGVDLVFIPAADEVYPPGHATQVHVAGLDQHLCGPHRPGHFVGVATVVAKLFNMVQPDRAYFGAKDAQQLAIIRRMTADLNLPIEIVGCPIVREPDGLAMSSRNVNLAPAARQRAPALYAALSAARDAVAAGERDAAVLVARMTALVAASQPDGVDYISAVDAETLQPVARVERPTLLALAVRFGGVRLIDNVTVQP